MIVAAAGAGRMGRGIAHVFAYAGHRVRVIDLKTRPAGAAAETLAQAEAAIAASVGMLQTLGQLSPQLTAKVLARITYHDRAGAADALAGAELIFEAVPEVIETKRQAFAEISAHAPPKAIIASTTSTILVDTLAEQVDRPARFLNAHWLNPAYLVPLVEVSPGRETAPEVVDEMRRILESVGKVAVVCAASPGYIVPRIQTLAMNEAARMVAEGVASPADMDRAIRVGFGLRFAVLGLIEFIDWGGGDILYYASNYLKEALDDDRFAPPEVVSQNMAAGRIGLKTGQGFYDYGETDIAAYQRETIAKFVDLIAHLGLLPRPSESDR